MQSYCKNKKNKEQSNIPTDKGKMPERSAHKTDQSYNLPCLHKLKDINKNNIKHERATHIRTRLSIEVRELKKELEITETVSEVNADVERTQNNSNNKIMP